MASINYAAREINVKIVYYGPGLSGKTTNLQVIHRKVPPEYKSDMVSLATETDRTLFFDFLPLDLGKIKGFATKFQLYTVPGQVYYNATRKLVLRGVDGVVFVVDSAQDKIEENIESFQNLEDNLAEYGYKRESIPIILQYNKRDLPNALSVEELEHYINKYNLPWGEAIANKGAGVFDSLKLIGKIVIDYLNKKYSRSGTRGGSAPVQQPGAQQPPRRPMKQAPGQQQSSSMYNQLGQGPQQPGPSFQSGPGQRPMYQQPSRQPSPPPPQMPINRSAGFRPPQQPLRQNQSFRPQQYPQGVDSSQEPQYSDRAPLPQRQVPPTGVRSPMHPSAPQEDFQDHATFEPAPNPQQQDQGGGAQEDYYNYGSITIEPMDAQRQSRMPAQEQYETFDPVRPPAPKKPGYDSSGKTDLDLEIERYQREIEEKQRRGGRSGQGAQNAYPPPPTAQQHPPQQSGSMTGQGSVQQDYEVYNVDNPSFDAQQQPVQPMMGSNEEEQMFFTSVDTDRHKKPMKRPVNPRTQQQKGFLSKFFNKDMT